MKLYISIIIFCLTILFSTTYSFSKETINYVGSSTIGAFINVASKKYKGAKVIVNSEPESLGGERIIASGDKRYDFGGVSREVSPELMAKGINKFIIGNDAVGLWINKRNPMTDLSIGDLRDIFSGKITNWKTVGGNDIPIQVYITDKKSPTWKIFQNVVLNDNEYLKSAVTAEENDLEVLENVGKDVGGIGHLGLGLALNKSMAVNVKKISIAAHKPEIGNRHYPIRWPLYLITRGHPKPSVKKFINWIRSEDGQAILQEYFIDHKY